MKKIILFLVFILGMFTYTNACHDAGVIETSAIDNGDGTYTYTFEACVGGLEDTWGFELTLNYLGGTGNIISYTNCITATNTDTSVDICASVPSTSGTGDIEYGDYDNTGNPVWSDGTTNECPVIELTVDTPLESVDMFGHQYGSTNCSNSTNTTSDCFTNVADYRIEVSSPNCSGNRTDSWNIEDPNGDIIASGVQGKSGNTIIYLVCGCGAKLNFTGESGGQCASGSLEAFNSDDSSLGSLSSSGSFELDCTEMPIELKYFKVIKEDNFNLIKWATYTEINNNYFTIERSTDGQNWDEIYTKSGAGNSNNTLYYEYRDKTFDKNINYYRLRQTDFDGTNESFNIVSIDNRGNKEIIKTINILGQEVDETYKGIVIYLYSDGSSKKTIR